MLVHLINHPPHPLPSPSLPSAPSRPRPPSSPSSRSSPASPFRTSNRGLAINSSFPPQELAISTDSVNPEILYTAEPPPRVIPITLFPSPFAFFSGRKVAVDGFISYATKAGRIRVIDQNSGARMLLRRHESQIIDMAITRPRGVVPDPAGPANRRWRCIASIAADARLVISKVPVRFEQDSASYEILVDILAHRAQPSFPADPLAASSPNSNPSSSASSASSPSPPPHSQALFSALRCHPRDASVLLVSTTDSRLILIRLDRGAYAGMWKRGLPLGKTLTEAEAFEGQDVLKVSSNVVAFCFSPDGSAFAYVTQDDILTVRQTCKPHWTLMGGQLPKHASEVMKLDFISSPNGQPVGFLIGRNRGTRIQVVQLIQVSESVITVDLIPPPLPEDSGTPHEFFGHMAWQAHYSTILVSNSIRGSIFAFHLNLCEPSCSTGGSSGGGSDEVVPHIVRGLTAIPTLDPHSITPEDNASYIESVAAKRQHQSTSTMANAGGQVMERARSSSWAAARTVFVDHISEIACPEPIISFVVDEGLRPLPLPAGGGALLSDCSIFIIHPKGIHQMYLPKDVMEPHQRDHKKISLHNQIILPAGGSCSLARPEGCSPPARRRSLAGEILVNVEVQEEVALVEKHMLSQRGPAVASIATGCGIGGSGTPPIAMSAASTDPASTTFTISTAPLQPPLTCPSGNLTLGTSSHSQPATEPETLVSPLSRQPQDEPPAPQPGQTLIEPPIPPTSSLTLQQQTTPTTSEIVHTRRDDAFNSLTSTQNAASSVLVPVDIQTAVAGADTGGAATSAPAKNGARGSVGGRSLATSRRQQARQRQHSSVSSVNVLDILSSAPLQRGSTSTTAAMTAVAPLSLKEQVASRVANSSSGEPVLGASGGAGLAMKEQLKRMEGTLVEKVRKMLMGEMEKQEQRMAEERASHQFAEVERQETLIRLVSETLTKNTSKVLEGIVRNEVRGSIGGGLARAVETRLVEQGVQECLNRNLRCEVERVFRTPEVLDQISRSVREGIERRVSQTVKETLGAVMAPVVDQVAQDRHVDSVALKDNVVGLRQGLGEVRKEVKEERKEVQELRTMLERTEQQVTGLRADLEQLLTTLSLGGPGVGGHSIGSPTLRHSERDQSSVNSKGERAVLPGQVALGSSAVPPILPRSSASAGSALPDTRSQEQGSSSSRSGSWARPKTPINAYEDMFMDALSDPSPRKLSKLIDEGSHDRLQSVFEMGGQAGDHKDPTWRSKPWVSVLSQPVVLTLAHKLSEEIAGRNSDGDNPSDPRNDHDCQQQQGGGLLLGKRGTNRLRWIWSCVKSINYQDDQTKMYLDRVLEVCWNELEHRRVRLMNGMMRLMMQKQRGQGESSVESDVLTGEIKEEVDGINEVLKLIEEKKREGQVVDLAPTNHSNPPLIDPSSQANKSSLQGGRHSWSLSDKTSNTQHPGSGNLNGSALNHLEQQQPPVPQKIHSIHCDRIPNGGGSGSGGWEGQ